MTSWDKSQVDIDWSTVQKEEKNLVGIIIGTFLGWPLKATIVWAVLLWAGPPLALTWFQAFLVVGLFDFLHGCASS